MNEVKMPKRPILAYYILIFLAIFLFNSIFVPMLRENAVKEVDYSSFMTMTENQEIDQGTGGAGQDPLYEEGRQAGIQDSSHE